MLEEISKLNACPEAMKWLRGQESPEDAWKTCQRADWMLWLAMKKAGSTGWSTREDVLLLLCDIVEPLVRPLEDPRPLRAISVARSYLRGYVPHDELVHASRVAYSAVRVASYAIAADADAAAAAYACAYASYAIAYAAYAIAYAAYAIADAAAADAYAAAADAAAAAYAAGDKEKALAKMVDLVRERLTLGEL